MMKKLNDTDNPIDETLLRQFFEAHKTEVSDDGFTQQVMETIRVQEETSKDKSLLRLMVAEKMWKLVCGLLFLVYVVVADCIPVVKALVSRVSNNALHALTSITFSWTYVAIALGVIIAIDIYLGKKFVKGEMKNDHILIK